MRRKLLILCGGLLLLSRLCGCIIADGDRDHRDHDHDHDHPVIIEPDHDDHR